MEQATEDERENFLICQMIQDFSDNAVELAGKYGSFSYVPVYTALSILICKAALAEGMSAHTLMEGILHTYRGLEQSQKENEQ